MTVDMCSSASNIKRIRQQFDEVIYHSQGFYPNTEALFDKWFEAKHDIIEAWGGKLAIEVPEKVVFHLSQKDRDQRLDEFISSVSITYDNDLLACFLDDNRDGFFENKTLRPWHEFNIDVPAGMKIIKAFKLFERDEYTLDKLQTQASMIIQEDKIEGTLCFSVHPLDFLSSSENTYHWRSCHALDGDYRAGNLSYMVDTATIVCYLRGAEEAKLPNFPPSVLWNSKKWRMLMFISPNWDVMFAGRQYPFFSSTALDITLDHLKHALYPYMYTSWSHWHNDYTDIFNFKEHPEDGGMLMHRYVCISNELMDLHQVIKDGKDSLQFNDLLRSSCYTPYYSYKNFRPIGVIPTITVGESVPCLRCGEDHIVASDTMLCEDCELNGGYSEDERFGYCELCDRRTLVADMYYLPGTGQLICESCHEHETTYCESCNQDILNCDIVLDKQTHEYICTTCFEHRYQNTEDYTF